MSSWTVLLKPWALSVLALSVGPGCGDDAGAPPRLGPNLIRNGSFEELKLESTWWTASNDTKDSKAYVSAEAADLGSMGLVLHKGTGTGWGSMVGQETEPHQAGETYQVRARLRGVQGGERVTLSFHKQSFEVETQAQWRTVTRLVLMPEGLEDTTTIISVTSNASTVHVDDVSVARAEVTRGDADEAEDNLLRNGSFESGLGMWTSFTDGGREGIADTSPEAGQSGYAGMVLSKGPAGERVLVKQELRDPVAEREEYHLEAHVRGAAGGEAVALCMQIDEAPWDGPCVAVTAEKSWTPGRLERAGPGLANQRVPALDDNRVDRPRRLAAWLSAGPDPVGHPWSRPA